MVPVLVSILILGSLGLSHQAFAVPTFPTFVDDPNCDPLFVPPSVDELGTDPGFTTSPDELITAADGGASPIAACPLSETPPSVPALSPLVTIANTVSPPRAFTDVWYVADNPDTIITNFDGFVNGGLHAFRIDNEACDPGGINHPLILETLTPDCIFEPGESWTFIIDGFSTVGGPPGPPTALGSIGVPSPEIFGPLAISTGSIIALHDEGPPIGGTSIPLDTTALLVAGAQTISPWLILGVLSAVGIGLAVFTLKRNKN